MIKCELYFLEAENKTNLNLKIILHHFLELSIGGDIGEVGEGKENQKSRNN